MSASIWAKLGLDSSEFQKGIDRASNQLKGFTGKFLGASFGIGAVTAAIGKAYSVLTGFAGDLGDQSDALDLNVESFQRLVGAFEQSGATQGDFVKGMTRLNQAIADARSGNIKLVETFERLGVKWKSILSDSPDEILLKIADAAKDSKDPTQSLTDILDVLGKAGIKLKPGLMEGSDAIRELGDASVVATEEAVRMAKEFDDAMVSMERSAKAGALNAVHWIKDAFGSVKEFAGTALTGGIGAAIGTKLGKDIANSTVNSLMETGAKAASGAGVVGAGGLTPRKPGAIDPRVKKDNEDRLKNEQKIKTQLEQQTKEIQRQVAERRKEEVDSRLSTPAERLAAKRAGRRRRKAESAQFESEARKLRGGKALQDELGPGEEGPRAPTAQDLKAAAAQAKSDYSDITGGKTLADLWERLGNKLVNQ